MAKFGVWWNGYIQIAGVDLSNQCQSFELTQERPELDFHSHGDDFRLKTAGLIDAGLTARFFTDFGAGAVVATLSPLHSGNTVFPIIFKPASGSTSQTNPQWSGNYQIGRFNPMRGEHGAVLMTEVTFMPVTKVVYSIT
jgi:hypothetical protein